MKDVKKRVLLSEKDGTPNFRMRLFKAESAGLMRRFLFFLLTALFLVSPGMAQIYVGENHPELQWMIIETVHFKIIYHKEVTDVAQEAAGVAESSYYSITRAMRMVPGDKIVLVLQDTDDYSNGMSNPLGHVMTIWTPPMPKYTTGKMKWLRRVIAHELTHEIHFWGLRSRFGIWTELLGIGTTPDWFTEGLAQYQAETWDIHRDLLLRVAWWSQKLLRVKDIQGFVGTDPIDSRLVYEEGHSLVRYMSRRWGEAVFPQLIKKHKQFLLSFDWNLYRKTHSTERRLYRAWLDSVTQHYLKWKTGREFMADAAKPFRTPFQGVYSVRESPDGLKAAVVGIRKFDEWMPELRIFDKKSKAWKSFGGTYVHAQTSWSPDGKKLVYSRAHPGISQSITDDLFLYDFDRGKEIQLTQNVRASDPDFSPDGRRLVFVKHFSGRCNLMIYDWRRKTIQQLTDFPLRTAVFAPRWSPDGRTIAFSLVDSSGKRTVAAISPDGDSLRVLQNSGYDARSPDWSPCGKKIAYIDYRFGTPNLFVMNRDGSNPQAVTNAFGGIFNPNWSPDGARIFATVFEKRDSIGIFSIPADRRVQPHFGPLEIPWTWDNQTFKRFPAHLEKTQIGRIMDYYSPNYLQSLILLPAVLKDDRGYEGGFLHILADPLNEHQLQSLVTIGDRRFTADFKYVNTQYMPTIMVNAGQLYRNCGNFPGYSGSLWERHRYASVGLSLPVSFGKNLRAGHFISTQFNVTQIRNLSVKKFKPVRENDLPFTGFVNEWSLFYAYRWQLPDLANDIHPATGVYLRTGFRWAGRLIGSDLRYKEWQAQIAARKMFSFHRNVLAARMGGLWHEGGRMIQSPPQLSTRYVRGLSASLEGTRQIYGNLEYRIQLIRNLHLYFLRFLYFERFTLAFFTDAGKAWGRNTQTLFTRRIPDFNESPWKTTFGAEWRMRVWPWAKMPIVFRIGAGREFGPKKSWKIYFLFAPVF